MIAYYHHTANRLEKITDLSGKSRPYTWEVQTNSLGLREDTDSPAANPAGTTRWLALGDSWVFGTSVTQGMT